MLLPVSCVGVKLHTYQTPESKKEEFRKYLEKSGVIDALTKVLVGLYEEPERPPNAVDYIKRYLRYYTQGGGANKTSIHHTSRAVSAVVFAHTSYDYYKV